MLVKKEIIKPKDHIQAPCIKSAHEKLIWQMDDFNIRIIVEVLRKYRSWGWKTSFFDIVGNSLLHALIDK